jgi:hypothetical protein
MSMESYTAVGRKSITMPAEIKEKWLSALRSGEYQQGFGSLCDGRGGYCCLGVLEMVVSGRVEDDALAFEPKFASFPSVEWLQEHNILFQRQSGDLANGTLRAPMLFLREERTGYEGMFNAAHVNDAGASFEQMADFLEASIEST